MVNEALPGPFILAKNSGGLGAEPPGGRTSGSRKPGARDRALPPAILEELFEQGCGLTFPDPAIDLR
jgi:hypothetical protein